MKSKSFLPDVLVCTLREGKNKAEILETYALYKILLGLGKNPVICDSFVKGENAYTDYIRKYTCTSSKLYGEAVYTEFAESYDFLVSGTSGIWTWSKDADLDYMFLNFGRKDAGRISYAATFGEDCKIPLGPRNAASFLLDRIARKAVADTNTLRIMELVLKKQADYVCNPVLLLEDYTTENEGKNDLYILADMENRDGQKQRAYEMAEATLKYRIEDVSEDKGNVSMDEYIALLKNAAFIITDSVVTMHLALVYHRPFIMLASGDKKDIKEFEDILELLQLQERIIYIEEDIYEKKYLCKKPVRYNMIDKKLAAIREEAINWIKESLAMENRG